MAPPYEMLRLLGSPQKECRFIFANPLVRQHTPLGPCRKEANGEGRQSSPGARICDCPAVPSAVCRPPSAVTPESKMSAFMTTVTHSQPCRREWCPTTRRLPVDCPQRCDSVLRLGYSIEFKRQVAQEFLGGETLYGLARRHDVSLDIAQPHPDLVREVRSGRVRRGGPGRGPSAAVRSEDFGAGAPDRAPSARDQVSKGGSVKRTSGRKRAYIGPCPPRGTSVARGCRGR